MSHATVTLGTLDARLAMIESDIRWLEQEDLHGSLLCLEHSCPNVRDAYEQRRAKRTRLQQDHLRLTLEYVDMLAVKPNVEAPVRTGFDFCCPECHRAGTAAYSDYLPWCSRECATASGKGE